MDITENDIIEGHGGIGGPAGISTVDMERTLKSLNGYHEVEVQYFSILVCFFNFNF